LTAALKLYFLRTISRFIEIFFLQTMLAIYYNIYPYIVSLKLSRRNNSNRNK